MSDQHRFRLNSPRVVSEAVDGEAIIVNLDSGTYYSIKGDGILIWDAIVAGAPVDEIAAAVSSQTGASVETVQPALTAFSQSLSAEGLIVPREDVGEPPVVDVSSGGPGLLQPTLESFSDMQDLILLDPVHEVDEQGWPHVQAGA
jgi:hypothetical protein